MRSDDLSSLAVELDLQDDQLQGLLAHLLDLTPAGAQYTARALLVGALVAVIASGAVGTSWLAPSASAAAPTAPDPVVAEHVLVDDSQAADTVEIEIGEAVVQESATFAAGDLGPTPRGPAFAPEHPGELPLMPHAEVTPDAVPYVMFSVDPAGTSATESREDGAGDIVDAVEVVDPAGVDDGSGVFSVTPRTESRDVADVDPAAQAALPPGSPELPPGG